MFLIGIPLVRAQISSGINNSLWKIANGVISPVVSTWKISVQNFNTNSTTTQLVTGNGTLAMPESTTRISVGTTTYDGYGGMLDQFTVDGRFNTQDWNYAFCDKVSSTGGTASLSNVCGQFSYASSTNATQRSTGVPTGGYAYDSVAIPAGAINPTQITVSGGAGAMFSFGAVQNGLAWLVPATSTPVMEITARINSPQNSTTTNYYIGFTSLNGNTTVPFFTGIPTSGCYFTASSTQANWIAVATNSGTATTSVDTGVASSTNITSTGGFYRFRIEADSTKCNFYIQPNQASNLAKVAVITTSIPSTVGLMSQIWIAEAGGLANQIDFFRYHVWWRDFLPVL